MGLVLYYFFQRVISLFLFLVLYSGFPKLVFLFLCAKLGLFPFFYWIIIVRVKVGFFTNIFVLSFQKLSVFWLIWLTLDVNLRLVLLIVYIRLFFVIINLLLVSDLWLIIIYSSIVNTGLIVLRIYGSYFLFILLLYLLIIFFIINFIIKIDSYLEIVFIVFIFLVIPPFILFFIKLYFIMRIEFFSKIIFYLIIFDAIILLYYFRLIFMKFLLMELNFIIIFINLLFLIILVFFRNCVTMIVFY